MGSTSASRLTASYFGSVATTLGAVGGAESKTLTAAQIPTITSANASQAISVTSTLSDWTRATVQVQSGSGGSGISAAGSVTSTGNNSISVTSNNTGGASTIIAVASPAMVVTIYIKL
jgi:microcystin-dependent protein